ncbi:hypothetical protein [Psychromonas sp. SA13A]|uniref:hypothetical protein n=1 Tax=Psychromonas sp. SA13A TaxID=2686346 RepID=UPI00140A8104|nr:hypothetical protein [Psychromonas sp. SA13A]
MLNKSEKNNEEHKVLGTEESENYTWLIESTPNYWTVKNESNAQTGTTKMYFNKPIAPGCLLTNDNFLLLKKDLERTYKFIVEQGYIKKSRQLVQSHYYIINFIYYINEKRSLEKQPAILGMAQLTQNDVINYIKTYAPTIELTSAVVAEVTNPNFLGTKKNWEKLRRKLSLTKQDLALLKSRISNSKNKALYISKTTTKREFADANKTRGIEELHLPNSKTVDNVIYYIELLFKASVIQESKFSFSPLSMFNDGTLLFKIFQSFRKTAIIPLDTAFHLIAKAAEFNSVYAKPLLEYLKEVDGYFLKHSTLLSNSRLNNDSKNKIIQDAVKLPIELIPLNIKKLGFRYDNDDFKDEFNRNGMTLITAIQLCFASIFILSTSFLATRKASIELLKKNSFVTSEMDDSYEIFFEQMKTLNSQVSQTISRPIPERVYDWGIQAVELSLYLDSRRGLNLPESDSFLFTENMVIFGFFSTDNNNSKGSISKGVGKDFIQTLLDIFSDWCETPLSSDERWYCTPHQLRRIFAVLYFNLTNECGIEELAWMLGQDSLKVTFSYAEVSPDEHWLDLAKVHLVNQANALLSSIETDRELKEIIDTSKKTSIKLNLQLEDVVYEAINKRIADTGEEVHFKKLANNNIYFYFSEGNLNG